MDRTKLYQDAKLTTEEINRMGGHLKGDTELYKFSEFGKLYTYFCNEGDMPQDIAQDGDQEEWILNELEYEHAYETVTPEESRNGKF